MQATVTVSALARITGRPSVALDPGCMYIGCDPTPSVKVTVDDAAGTLARAAAPAIDSAARSVAAYMAEHKANGTGPYAPHARPGAAAIRAAAMRASLPALRAAIDSADPRNWRVSILRDVLALRSRPACPDMARAFALAPVRQ